jgi:hypothetical protein
MLVYGPIMRMEIPSFGNQGVKDSKLKLSRGQLFYFQYPGVAASIDSDIDNLMSVMSVSNILPRGENNF